MARGDRHRYRGVLAGIGALVCTFAMLPWGTASASTGDPFYVYSGAAPLSAHAPGAVLATRTVSLHLSGISLPVQAVQLLYRSTSALGAPTANVASVLEPPVETGPAQTLVAYGSFYDSMNPNDSPSRSIAGEANNDTSGFTAEEAFMVPMLLTGHPVVVADTEGQDPDLPVGRVYGYNTLDALRATLNSPAANVSRTAKMALYGYSGGAIATEWAAELAPTYAPAINRQLVGATFGGTFVDPFHNLSYVSGTETWGGVIPLALVGIARAYGLDLSPYLSAAGQTAISQAQNMIIGQAQDAFAYESWSKLFKPQYPTPESIPAFTHAADQMIMGTGGTPTVPLLVDQGLNGPAENTPPSPIYGAGDGVMLAGDVRTLLRDYCSAGVAVEYQENPLLSHTPEGVAWLPDAITWLLGRFAGTPAPDDCSTIAPGNSIAPVSFASVPGAGPTTGGHQAASTAAASPSVESGTVVSTSAGPATTDLPTTGVPALPLAAAAVVLILLGADVLVLARQRRWRARPER